MHDTLRHVSVEADQVAASTLCCDAVQETENITLFSVIKKKLMVT